MPERFDCRNFEDTALLYAAGELGEPERAAVEAHARECAACAALLDREIVLRAAIVARGDAAETLDRSGLLLAHCRSELAEALDDAEQHAAPSGWRALWSPLQWRAGLGRVLELHPGWAMAGLLMAGAIGGVGVRAWIHNTALPLPDSPVMTVSAAPRLTDQELETMGIDGIHLEEQGGASTPHVEVQISSSRPVVMQGSADDAEIRRVLTYVIAHPQRFTSGVRLDSLDALRSHVSEPQVRHTLCEAARHDRNPAVRLKALEALYGLGNDPDAMQAMLAALSADDNSGVRIEAVNSLWAALGATGAGIPPLDAGVVGVLRDRMENDPNHYIRQRSATVLARLASLDSGATGQPESIGRIHP
jgi:hypothetical protein